MTLRLHQCGDGIAAASAAVGGPAVFDLLCPTGETFLLVIDEITKNLWIYFRASVGKVYSPYFQNGISAVRLFSNIRPILAVERSDLGQQWPQTIPRAFRPECY